MGLFNFRFMIQIKFIIFLFFANYALAQSPAFPIDDSGKYIFSDVIAVPGINKGELYSKGEKFIQQLEVHNSTQNNLRKNHEDSTLFNKGSFVVHNLGAVKNSVGGIVVFDMTLEFKDEKYRYTITNFIFNPYKRNRYGKFESVAGKYTPLEKEVSRLNNKEWAKYRKEVYNDSQALIKKLNQEMTYKESDHLKKVIKEENW